MSALIDSYDRQLTILAYIRSKNPILTTWCSTTARLSTQQTPKHTHTATTSARPTDEQPSRNMPSTTTEPHTRSLHDQLPGVGRRPVSSTAGPISLRFAPDADGNADEDQR